jgi:hypothetical protein
MGYRNPDAYRSEDALDPLRSRDDFRLLMIAAPIASVGVVRRDIDLWVRVGARHRGTRGSRPTARSACLRHRAPAPAREPQVAPHRPTQRPTAVPGPTAGPTHGPGPARQDPAVGTADPFAQTAPSSRPRPTGPDPRHDAAGLAPDGRPFDGLIPRRCGDGGGRGARLRGSGTTDRAARLMRMIVPQSYHGSGFTASARLGRDGGARKSVRFENVNAISSP